MVNCVITLSQDGIAQTHVQLATAQTVLCHVVCRVAILAVRVVLHARHITHQPRTIGLDILDLDSHSRVVRDAVVGRLFDLTTCGVAIHTDVQRNRSLQQSRMHIQAAIMDNQLVVADRFTIRVNDRMNIQCRTTLGVGVDSYQIRSQELVVVMAEIAGLILVVPLKIIIGARTICVQRQGTDGAIGHKRDIGLAFLDIFLLTIIVGIHKFLSQVGGITARNVQDAADCIFRLELCIQNRSSVNVAHDINQICIIIFHLNVHMEVRVLVVDNLIAVKNRHMQRTRVNDKAAIQNHDNIVLQDGVIGFSQANIS